MPYDFYKYHALGNDYLVIDPNRTQFEPTPDNIRTICHRNYGIGSDGILYGPVFENGMIHLRIFNPDGSEAEKSGNGIRIFARYLWDEGYQKSDQFTIQTLGGIVRISRLDLNTELIKVTMGKVTFQSDLIPVNGPSREVVNEKLELSSGSQYQVTCLSIGNPHCVIPLQRISKELTQEIGPLIENHSLFPNRINMQLLKVIDRNTVQIEIWERGAGYTLASGSSSCAAASAANRLGLVDERVKVLMPGGELTVEINPDGMVDLNGPVTKVAVGNFSAEFRALLK